MRRYIAILTLAVIVLVPQTTFASSSPIYSPTDLITKALELDGKTITVRGEAITEALERKDEYSWVNIFDGSSAIGVWMKNDLKDQIKNYGTNLVKGDIVEITGKFFRNDPEADGELDLRADSLKIVENGYPTPEKIDPLKVITLVILSLVVLLLLIDNIYKNKKKTQEKKEGFEIENAIHEELE
ncbi:MAG: DNA-binding protein [Caldisericia bacterium]|jgi:hypothetical protein|nr:DNA-binding protein [Caldisericia bacterium]